LQARSRTGRGQVVETSLMEAALQQMYWQAAIYFATGVSSGPTGSAHILTAPYQAFPTADGWINIGGANQPNWERIARTIGRPELIDDPRFKTNGERMKHLDELVPLISERTKTRASAEWIREFETAGVPVGPINSIGKVLADPQVKARDMLVEVEHSTLGRTKATGLPIKFSETPGGVVRGAPTLGEHTDEVLSALGYDRDAIGRLRAEGAVA
jgi:crotonobetainyl-CoA:carnitine CoA-transferase CaiB-like acyl-CoA transferase